ncbi:MAG: hypothetical protein ACJAS1_006589, partial [Oleiphilaceae bacterium]
SICQHCFRNFSPTNYNQRNLMSRKVAILQSNYIPWKGYFDLMDQVDDFVIYDVVQYTKRDWRNRNKIITPQGLLWLSVPVIVESRDQRIDATKIHDKNWVNKHLVSIKHNYGKAPYFDVYFDELRDCYQNAGNLEFLSEVNLVFLKWICAKLNIKTRLHSSREFELSTDKNERLAYICQQLNADVYLSGPAAKDYLDESCFADKNIAVEWMDYHGYPEYPQLFGEFEHSVTVLDALFNLGENAKSSVLRRYFGES